MKKRTVFFIIIFSLLISPVMGQLNNPALWESFVNNSDLNKNYLDTLLLQSFEGSSVEIWQYRDEGETPPEIVDAFSAYGIHGQKGNKSLRLPVGSKIYFPVGDVPEYCSSIFVSFYIAASDVSAGVPMHIYIPGSGRDMVDIKIQSDQVYNLNFGETFPGEKAPGRIQVKDPLEIKISVLSENGSGNYFMDHLSLTGTMPRYSLSSGTGEWNDDKLWSFGTPNGGRNALVKDKLVVKGEISCNEIHLADGVISISRGASLQNEQLFLHDSGAMYTAGKWTVSDGVIFYKTFPEKGKWYFASFPFDIYKKDIGNGFTLKDDTPNKGGDFLYVLEYDGEKRSRSNELDNWKVVSEKFSDNQPLFERGKGYLIALDKEASVNTVSFSYSGGKPVVWDAEAFSLFLEVPARTSQTKQEHHGWVLCGNPFPSPLPVKHIVSNSQLDGYLYYSDGNVYKPCPLDGDFIIPPYAAFFLKAKGSTFLSFNPVTTAPAGSLLPESEAANHMNEPLLQITKPEQQATSVSFNIRLQGRNLYVENNPGSGNLVVCNTGGNILLRQEVPAGNSLVYLDLPRGTYILSIQSGKEQAQEKFILY